MDLVFAILGIIALGFLLSVVIKQTYNFVFFLGKKPVLWIFLVTIVSGMFWLLCSSFGWTGSIPTLSATLAFLMNLPSGSTKKSKALADEIYSEMGLKHGVLLYRVGLCCFIVASICGWIIFYG